MDTNDLLEPLSLHDFVNVAVIRQRCTALAAALAVAPLDSPLERSLLHQKVALDSLLNACLWYERRFG
jgi:hypothetical protein